MSSDETVHAAVADAARAAQVAITDLAVAPDEVIDEALRTMADGLASHAAVLLAANADDMRAARAGGMGDGLLDRLHLDQARLDAIAGQLRALAAVPA
jgi:glutamate-5-semialdehyde dehydrogenase